MCSCSEAEEEKERKHINKDKLTIATKKMQKNNNKTYVGGGGHIKKYKLKIQKYTGTNPNTKT